MEKDFTVKVSPPPHVRVKVWQGNAWGREMRFATAFRIGRSHECEVQIREGAVSKVHAEVKFEEGQWWISDLGSANGTYLNGRRLGREPLVSTAKLELGYAGPILELSVGETSEIADAPDVTSPGREEPASVTGIIHRYLGSSDPSGGGEHTMLVRRAFERVRKQHSRRYQAILVIVVVLLLGAGSLAGYQHLKLRALRQTAGDIFYSMKQMELHIAQLEEVLIRTADPRQMDEILAKRQQIKKMQQRYDLFVEEIGLFEGLSQEERAIVRIARLFGECEATMPKKFVKEVNKYIHKWKSSNRLIRSIHRAERNGYIPTVTSAMLAHNLPPHFFYLALQESGFNSRAVGPKTRFGIAKGIWQFIPGTAVEYGLRTGPLKNLRRYDAKDERFHFEKATEAAAQYLKHLYTTEAQASGLLVMASYNWGQGNVNKKIRQMPKNPKERNFWQLLKRYKIPRETYDYVFYIISAAVIGENPQQFGFEFSNPIPRSGLS